MKSKKGGAYERELAKEFSIWWTQDHPDGATDDVFWRSSNSGGRATVRRRRGKKTRGHCGDLAATDRIGERFINHVTVELKCGYTKCVFADAFDRPRHLKQSTWEGFVEQASNAAGNAGTPYWLLITRRNSRQSIVFMPRQLFTELRERGAFVYKNPDRLRMPFVRLDVNIKNSDNQPEPMSIMAVRLIDFFRTVSPKHFPK